MEDTYLSPSNDPASKNYDSPSTVSFRPKVFPTDWGSNIGSSVSSAWPLPTFAQGKPQQFLGWRERLRRSGRGTYYTSLGSWARSHCPIALGAFCDWMPWRVSTYPGSGSPQGHTADGLSRSRSLSKGGETPLLISFLLLRPPSPSLAMPPPPPPPPPPLSSLSPSSTPFPSPSSPPKLLGLLSQPVLPCHFPSDHHGPHCEIMERLEAGPVTREMSWVGTAEQNLAGEEWSWGVSG